MGSDDLYKKQKELRDYKRRRFIREKRERILIVCEGGKTEPFYFEGFRLPNVTVKGFGYNTDSLVREAIALKTKAIKERASFDQVWCVFDRDSFPFENYNNAFIMAEKHNIKVAYTNEAFELWYLLHFHYCDSALSRMQYSDKLTERLAFVYDKTNTKMYDLLLDKQDTAIQYAKKLFEQRIEPNPHDHNPSTAVHLLVGELNKFFR